MRITEDERRAATWRAVTAVAVTLIGIGIIIALIEGIVGGVFLIVIVMIVALFVCVVTTISPILPRRAIWFDDDSNCR